MVFLTVSTTTGASLTSATATFSSGTGAGSSRRRGRCLGPAEPLLVFPVCDVVLVLDVAVQGAVEEAGGTPSPAPQDPCFCYS